MRENGADVAAAKDAVVGGSDEAESARGKLARQFPGRKNGMRECRAVDLVSCMHCFRTESSYRIANYRVHVLPSVEVTFASPVVGYDEYLDTSGSSRRKQFAEVIEQA